MLRSPASLSARRAVNSWVSRSVMPMPAKITAKAASPEPREPSTMRAASSRPGSPEPEKTGSFWPRTSVFMPSIAEIPVSTNSASFCRRVGLKGAP
jgi:hypothetical protein